MIKRVQTVLVTSDRKGLLTFPDLPELLLKKRLINFSVLHAANTILVLLASSRIQFTQNRWSKLTHKNT